MLKREAIKNNVGDMVVQWFGGKRKKKKYEMGDYRSIIPEKCAICTVFWGRLKDHDKPVAVYTYRDQEHYVCKECEEKRKYLKMSYSQFFEYDRGKYPLDP